MDQMGEKMGPDGGKRIDDHKFWAGSKENGSVFPMGAKVKEMESADGAGNLPVYEDSDAKIREMQEKGARKVRERPLKDSYRN